MKRSDWISNNEMEKEPPRPRLFSLTDEILDKVKADHKDHVASWPEHRLRLIETFLESIPEWLATETPKTGSVMDQIKSAGWESLDPGMQLWAVKTTWSGCLVTLQITYPGIKFNSGFVIDKDIQSQAWKVSEVQTYPDFGFAGIDHATGGHGTRIGTAGIGWNTTLEPRIVRLETQWNNMERGFAE